MEARLNIGRLQHKLPKESTSLVEILAAIAIGVFGMFLAELGGEINNPVIYWSGIVASVSAAGYITMKFLTAVRDFIWGFIDRSKKKDSHNTSK